VAAEEARGRALENGAVRWAADETSNMERTLLVARIADARQMGRWAPLREAREVQRLYGETVAAAEKAGRLAASRRRVAEAEARALVESAERALERALDLTRSARLPPADRRTLQRARVALREAKARLAVGDPDGARERARAAGDAFATATAHMTTRAARYVDPDNLERWRGWIEQTRAASRRSGGVAVVVVKERNELLLLEAGALRWRIPVELGANGVSDKARAGDRATPEGRYAVVEKRGPGSTRFYKALLLDYPNREDRRRFAEDQRSGRIPVGSTPGGMVEIHGEGGQGRNWTRGCVALDNDEMDRLFEIASVGTPVTIVGADGEGGIFSDLVKGAQRGLRR
jgi:L,D-transpeptidase catalytic domain